ncbi:hypothetical protein C8A01DRAFT_11833 [Parachaetomium inaequale]|uniref:Uncharacterized protein n=1 Tax=Parachaetomium inaequale TaxID=2588326 RepID=A0AAN6PR80_9PEZI|nr:hypothetical protein C8A01DRAFT_11833 [Parachaetomium inaequale]
MATQCNPFHAALGHGKRRTLAEIDAATRDTKTFKSLRRQPVQPIPNHERISEWLSRGVHPGGESFVEVNKPGAPQPNRRSPIFIVDDDKESFGQQPRSHAARAGTVARASHRAPYTPPSSRHLSFNGLKRKASNLDDSEEDVIIIQPPSSIQTRRPRPAPVIDLTKSDRPKRTTSFLGNRDDDVIIIDPPAAEMRRRLRPLLLGTPIATPRGSDIRPQKRRRQTPTASASVVERQVQQQPEAAAREPIAPEADVTEAAVLLQSVESMTHFFTLATEIRDKIYRHLLVSPKPIHVQHLWTELARRSTRRGGRGDDVETTIDTRILSVCRRTALEGIRILYSENTFLYLLRDPEVVESGSGGGRRSQRVAGRAWREREQDSRSINLAKYGHLLRHMAIELEPNRTATSYEKLMSAALETLAPASADSLPSPPRPLCSPIHLHTLTITVSPLLESMNRPVRAPAQGNQDVVIHEGRFLSMVSFFSRGKPVLKALQNLNADFLRINVHVNSDVKDDRSGTANNPWVGQVEDDVDDSDDDSDDDESDASSASAQRPKRRHLETTIDLRCLPRHLEALSREPGPVGQIWANDMLMQEKRRKQGAEAEEKVAHLRRHLEDACLRPEFSMLRGIWEDHGAAERRRKEQRAKEDARFDADAYGAGDEGGGEDGDGMRAARRMNSLILSISRVGDGLRAYRA